VIGIYIGKLKVKNVSVLRDILKMLKINAKVIYVLLNKNAQRIAKPVLKIFLTVLNVV
jgi:hypothetical protein